MGEFAVAVLHVGEDLHPAQGQQQRLQQLRLELQALFRGDLRRALYTIYIYKAALTMLQLSTEIPLAAVIWYAKRGGLLPPAKRERNRIEITQGEGGERGWG